MRLTIQLGLLHHRVIRDVFVVYVIAIFASLGTAFTDSDWERTGCANWFSFLVIARLHFCYYFVLYG